MPSPIVYCFSGFKNFYKQNFKVQKSIISADVNKRNASKLFSCRRYGTLYVFFIGSSFKESTATNNTVSSHSKKYHFILIQQKQNKSFFVERNSLTRAKRKLLSKRFFFVFSSKGACFLFLIWKKSFQSCSHTITPPIYWKGKDPSIDARKGSIFFSFCLSVFLNCLSVLMLVFHFKLSDCLYELSIFLYMCTFVILPGEVFKSVCLSFCLVFLLICLLSVSLFMCQIVYLFLLSFCLF